MTNLQGKRRKDLVLDLLRLKDWVTTAEICAVNVGGTEGTRRLRELRADGYHIEQRKLEGSSQFQYHLVERKINSAWNSRNEGATIADGSRSRVAALSTPFVAWHGEMNRGFTAKHRGFSMAVRPFWGDDRWVFVVTRQDGTQESGVAADLNEAKRKALAVAL